MNEVQFVGEIIGEASVRSRELASGLSAYLDPGSGSYLLQLLIASLMGALLMLRIYWQRVKGFLKGLFGASVDDEEE